MQWWVQSSEIVRNLALLFGGVFGLYLAWQRVSAATRQADASIRQAELGRRELVAELFNRAVGQLGDEKLEVRLGAIYTLRQIGVDFPDLTNAVFELLSTYIRENRAEYIDDQPPPDVREIMRILRTRLGDLS